VDLAETEAEISADFRQLPPNRQDCVLETARALSWAAKARTGEAVKPAVPRGTIRQENDRNQKFVIQKDGSQCKGIGHIK
jgi:hypothetical protein